MNLPIPYPFPPMEARPAKSLPTGEGWFYEPKWDGFRCILFRDGQDVELQSKNSKPLGRYFPEIVEQALRVPLTRFVLDGELVVPHQRRLDFEQLQLRLHPAESRIRKLSKETPADYVAFDLLVEGDRALQQEPFSRRRVALEALFDSSLAKGGWKLSPSVSEREQALEWLDSSGPSLDGVIAKQADEIYRSGERAGMIKVKNLRTVDCVVGGFRLDNSGTRIGSILLGLYNKHGQLDHVGHISGFAQDERRDLAARLKELEGPPGFTGNSPGGPSRWDPERSGEYSSLPHQLVVEVQYDHFSGGRFRHGARFKRWRPDKAPENCLDEQVRQNADPGFQLLQ